MTRFARTIVTPGERYGRLTIVDEASPNGKQRKFLCKCDCGKEKVILLQNLRNGLTQSCGCYHKQANNSPKPKLQSENYPYKNTRLFSIWEGMKKRCSDSKCLAYKYYGGKGIKVCDEWASSFLRFREWALRHGYKDNLTIEREHVDKDYCPGNCKWIPLSLQNRNKSSSRRLLCNGVQKTMVEWSEVVGIKVTTISGRLSKGWSDYNAVFTPVKPQKARCS